MPGYKELDTNVSIADQAASQEEGPVVLINVFHIDPAGHFWQLEIGVLVALKGLA